MELLWRDFVCRASLVHALPGLWVGALLGLAAAPAGAQPPVEATLSFHLGQEARREGDLVLAARWLAEAVRLDPEAPAPRLDWAEVLLATGDVEGAERALLPLAAWWEARGQGTDPAGARYARLRAAAAGRRGDPEGAIAWYERAAARAPADVGLRAQLIGLYRARGDTAQALVHLEAAAQALPRSGELKVELGRALLDTGRWREAEAAFAEAVDLDPGLERAWDGLGLARARRGDVRGAEEAFREGLRVAPASASIYEHLGDALLDDGRARAALQAYERAAALAPSEPRLAEKIDRARAALPR